MTGGETWEETVARYFDFFEKHLESKYNYQMNRKELEDAVLKMEVMPSMRALMTAGKALERDNTAGYNCFGGSEEFITDKGIISFEETVGTTVNVLNKDGDFVPAKVKSYGVQKLLKVRLKPTRNTNLRYEILVTPNHTWHTLNRGVINDLKIGDQLPSNANKNKFQTDPDAWLYGFGYGDGTIANRGRAQVRLCGNKNKYLQKFKDYGHNYVCSPPSYNGDNVVIFLKDFFITWKMLPYHESEDVGFLQEWLDGYLSADGSMAVKNPGLSSQNIEAIKFCKKIAPLCGYIVTGENTCSNQGTNYGPRKNPLSKITIRDEAIFYVDSIDEYDEQQVFCVEEPLTNTFTLACGVLTGNCSALPVDDPKAFDEALHILTCGTGVGFSVENQYVEKLPEIPEKLFSSETTIVVRDSKEGWAKALRQLIALLYAGEIPYYDLSKIRPKGARLKTFGGRASGPDPLKDLFAFVIQKFKGAAGRKLTSLECHDIMCKIAEVVVVGGVRRSAEISLSDLEDDRMRDAKTGNWWLANPQRALSNNSAVYNEKPDMGIFMKEWHALYSSYSGERGLFSRQAAKAVAKRNGRRDSNYEFLTNPCCFTGDMRLLTKDGYKTFLELSELESVEIVNSNGDVTTGKVWCSGLRHIVGLKTDRKLITCTPDHIFMLNDESECEAKDTLGKQLKCYSGKESIIVNEILNIGAFAVYDFTEPDTHWGIVEDIVVHNSEIILRPNQFCNLTSIVIRPEDTLETLKKKAFVATILGTFQSTLTHFPYLRKSWAKNTAEERLLGVSLTGICDHPILSQVSSESAEILSALREYVVQINKELAEVLDIQQSTATTCVKPEGNSAQLNNSSSGLHSRFSRYYIRRVRNDKKDPLAQYMIDAGVPFEDDVMNPSVYVFSFPRKSPETSVLRDDKTAIEQLEFWKQLQDHWCEHKPSATIYVREHEWMEVGAWVYKHFDSLSGVSFLPYDDGTYRQAPYEEIDEETYLQLVSEMPESIDWDSLIEEDDNVEGTQTLACTSGACEL